MAIFEGLFFLVLGIGLLLIDYRALTNGMLPCGANGFKGRLEFTKTEQPAGFWLMFAVYGGAGIWLVIYSLLLLAGDAKPLPLR
jgi:hypothetical protein